MRRHSHQIFERISTLNPLPHDEGDLLDAVRTLVRDKIAPGAEEIDQTAAVPRQNLDYLRDLELAYAFLPEGYGAGLSFSCYLQVVAELAWGCPSTAISWAGNFHALTPLREFGTKAQLDAYLPRVAAGADVALAITEPAGGSDLRDMRTRIELVDDDTIDITGSKAFITNGSYADFCVVFGLVRDRGLTAVLVDRDTPGFTVTGVEDKTGHRGSSTASLAFDGCRVPATQILGEVGQGRELLFRTLNWSRPSVAAEALGIAAAAFDEMIDYANMRDISGRKQIELEGLHPAIAQLATRLAQAQLWLRHVGTLADEGTTDIEIEASMLKLTTSELAVDMAAAAVQLHGGMGYVRGSRVERLLRDARVTTVWEGASELQRRRIARGFRTVSDD